MANFISKLYYNTVLGHELIAPFAKCYEFLKFGLTPDAVKMKREFIKNLGFIPNFEKPETLNEKIQWLKLNDRTSLHTQCADKYKVRAYVKERIGEDYLVPLVFQTKNVRDIVPENLPDYPIIIKTNHDSSGGLIIKDKIGINWTQVQNTLGKNKTINYYYRFKEWQYKNIESRVIVEELLIDDHGQIPMDYKMYFFNGKLEFSQVDIGRFEGERGRNFYSKDWELLDFVMKIPNGKPLAQPERYDELVLLGEKLAAPFCFVRVDFYCYDGKIYFGELTFHPSSGHCKFNPREYDKKFGEKLKLHVAKI
ncbi:glycosyl transferase [Bizionia argentinensis JUB59]|uniref:Glycosyl transferase n=1 Tax=Bizionia argentinensis JUB59 TaxID=1046627 RepID=G2E9B0_9FLAO|nr:ATP-grasp fold amidoligase family protein [Bizionia argentinensis]EGV44832.1 glycosyl transferase [Bizionia argentinensis JUB59]